MIAFVSLFSEKEVEFALEMLKSLLFGSVLYRVRLIYIGLWGPSRKILLTTLDSMSRTSVEWGIGKYFKNIMELKLVCTKPVAFEFLFKSEEIALKAMLNYLYQWSLESNQLEANMYAFHELDHHSYRLSFVPCEDDKNKQNLEMFGQKTGNVVGMEVAGDIESVAVNDASNNVEGKDEDEYWNNLEPLEVEAIVNNFTRLRILGNMSKEFAVEEFQKIIADLHIEDFSIEMHCKFLDFIFSCPIATTKVFKLLQMRESYDVLLMEGIG
mmetsp:Transcript_20098/g.29705  ORF Transcript_20098/g.29705 Transcript_20098/m.29705 type:complete len:269 (-) Transcript_20098:91-897(-)